MTALATGAAVATWQGRPPEALDRVVVLAPHPDDEVLACGALMTWLHDLGHHLSIVAVTDGEGSHARSRRVDPDALRARRADERAAALSRLGLDVGVERLGLPDGAVRTHEARLQRALEDRLDPRTTVVAPWRRDGHPDHEATGRAALVAARRTGAHLWEVPIWAKVAGPPPLSVRPGSRLLLSDEQQRRKRESVACFRSQLHAQGPDAVDGPVVHPHEVAAMLDGHEDVLWR